MARTADTLKTPRRANDRWAIDAPSLRTQVSVDAAQARGPPGQPVVRRFWCVQAQPHVTGPGASVPTVMADGCDARLKEYVLSKSNFIFPCSAPINGQERTMKKHCSTT